MKADEKALFAQMLKDTWAAYGKEAPPPHFAYLLEWVAVVDPGGRHGSTWTPLSGPRPGPLPTKAGRSGLSTAPYE